MKTQRDIAKAAGVSLKTVSRVLNGDPAVSAETREIVERLMREAAYQPSIPARLMRSKTSNVVGFIANRVATSSSSIDLIRGAQDAAWELGRQMMLFNIKGSPEDERLAEAQLSQFRAEAVIYATISHQAVALAPAPRRRVLLNCFLHRGGEAAFVPDDYDMGGALTAHVLSKGFRRPLFLNLSDDHVAAGLRRAGFLDEGAAQGLDLEASVLPAMERTATGHCPIVHEVLPPLMERPDRPDSIICGQDILAMQAYFVLARMGFVVGRDVGVGSFDNQDPIPENPNPSITAWVIDGEAEKGYFTQLEESFNASQSGITDDVVPIRVQRGHPSRDPVGQPA